MLDCVELEMLQNDIFLDTSRVATAGNSFLKLAC